MKATLMYGAGDVRVGARDRPRRSAGRLPRDGRTRIDQGTDQAMSAWTPQARPALGGRMQTRSLGNALDVSAIGLGCMGVSTAFPPIPERQEMISLLRTAVERGITFFDTAQVYGPFA